MDASGSRRDSSRVEVTRRNGKQYVYEKNNPDTTRPRLRGDGTNSRKFVYAAASNLATSSEQSSNVIQGIQADHDMRKMSEWAKRR